MKQSTKHRLLLAVQVLFIFCIDAVCVVEVQ